MCIAIYSPVGVDLPCEEYLKASFDNNPDGAGFAYNTDEYNVQIEKGFMDWKSFKKAIEKSNKKNDLKNRGVLIHFRITTHGGTNPECCHPFPLVADEAAMKKTKIRTNFAVIHNGIISLTSDEAHKRVRMSDTMVFIEKYLAKIATNKKWFSNKANFELIGDLIDSKMAILNGYGEIHATDGFVKDVDGNYYSNTTYKYDRYFFYRSAKSSSSFSKPYDSFSFYDDDEYETWYNNEFANSTTILPASSTVEFIDDEKTEGVDWEPLMMMQPDMIACFEDNTEEEYDPQFPIFTDDSGNIYAARADNVNDITRFVVDPWPWNSGWFVYKKSYQPVDFKPDYRADVEDLYDFS